MITTTDRPSPIAHFGGWIEIERRFRAYWTGEALDRCVISVSCPMPNGVYEPFRAPDSLEEQWLDSAYTSSRFEYGLDKIWMAGEAMPIYWPNFGPGCLAAFLGASYTLSQSTVWFHPKKEGELSIDSIHLNLENTLLQTVTQTTEHMVKKAGGRYLVAMPDLGGTLDILASLCGTQNMLVSMLDDPEYIDEAVAAIDRGWIEAYEMFDALISPHQNGSSCWLPLYHPGRTYPLQCDASVMISPQQFERFVLPSLHRQSKVLDDAIYHLDGDGEIVHLDSILSVPGVSAIEWIPVKYRIDDPIYFPMFQKIQESGRRLILRGVAKDKMEALLKNTDSSKLFLTTDAKSPGECDQILDNAIKWKQP